MIESLDEGLVERLKMRCQALKVIEDGFETDIANFAKVSIELLGNDASTQLDVSEVQRSGTHSWSSAL